MPDGEKVKVPLPEKLQVQVRSGYVRKGKSYI